MKKIFLIAAISLIAFSAQAQDKFLNGYINACEPTPQYIKFQKDLCKFSNKKDSIGECKFGKVSLPVPYSNLVDSHTVKNNGDHTNFEVKLKPGMKFAGNNVVGIEQWTGHENGIWGGALILEESSIKQVKKNITASGVKLKQIKNEMGESGAEVLEGEDKRVRVVCDLSN